MQGRQVYVKRYAEVMILLPDADGACAAGGVTRLTSGVGSASRFGFRGAEDLGGGMSAIFTLETGHPFGWSALSMPAGGRPIRLRGK
jgi:hypothetical protein